VHEAAHDALSDVRATIALARLIRSKQPKLFDFCLELRRKDKVASEMGLHLEPQPAPAFLHVSGMFPAERGCLGWCGRWPPTRPTRTKCWSGIAATIRPSCSALDADTIRSACSRAQRRAAGRDDAPADQERAPEQIADAGREPEDAVAGHGGEVGTRPRAGPGARAHRGRRAGHERHLGSRCSSARQGAPVDVDEDLYNGFVGRATGASWKSLRGETPAKLATASELRGRTPGWSCCSATARATSRTRCIGRRDGALGSSTARRACSTAPAARAPSTSFRRDRCAVNRMPTSAPRTSWASCTITRSDRAGVW
jgi:exodeoxyribonuclease-1